MAATYYLATALANAARAVQIQEALEAAGLRPIHDWARARLASSAPEAEWEAAQAVRAEAKAIASCGVFVLATPYKRGGATELGIALGTGRPCVLFLDGDGGAHDFARHLINAKADTLELVVWLARSLAEARKPGLPTEASRALIELGLEVRAGEVRKAAGFSKPDRGEETPPVPA